MISIVSHTNKEQGMKQKFGRILIGIVVIFAVFGYAHIAKTHDVYDRNIDTSEYKDTNVCLNEEVAQSFICQEEHLDGVRVKCRLIGEAKNVVIDYFLIDKETNTQLVQGTVKGSQIKNGKFFEFPFDTIKNTRGKQYEFKIIEKGEDSDNSVNFCYTSKKEKNTNMSLNGDDLEGTVVLRTVTNRFDLETFCVLLIFILYIIAFMRFLYKLFR